jgi:hemoglobin-like flavoprotein
MNELTIVKKSWRILRNVDPALLGEVFYTRLYSQMPNSKGIFKTGLEDNYGKMIDLMSYAIARVDNLETLALELARLAKTHINPDFKIEHYRIFNEALLWTLEKGLGNDWNLEVKNAWRTCLQSVQMPG